MGNDFLLTQENSIHMLWLLPQYFVITTGEIMLSITGLEFSYSQAPESMKSVLQAAWLLNVAFGNIIVIIVAEAKAFDSQASEFFMFGILMLVDMALFSFLAYRYKYVDNSKKYSENLELEEKTSFSFSLKMFLSSPRVDSIFSRENWFSPSEDLSLATQELSSVTVLSSRTHSFTRTSSFFIQVSETALTLLYLSLRPATSVSASVWVVIF